MEKNIHTQLYFGPKVTEREHRLIGISDEAGEARAELKDAPAKKKSPDAKVDEKEDKSKVLPDKTDLLKKLEEMKALIEKGDDSMRKDGTKKIEELVQSGKVDVIDAALQVTGMKPEKIQALLDARSPDDAAKVLKDMSRDLKLGDVNTIGPTIVALLNGKLQASGKTMRVELRGAEFVVERSILVPPTPLAAPSETLSPDEKKMGSDLRSAIDKNDPAAQATIMKALNDIYKGLPTTNLLTKSVKLSEYLNGTNRTISLKLPGSTELVLIEGSPVKTEKAEATEGTKHLIDILKDLLKALLGVKLPGDIFNNEPVVALQAELSGLKGDEVALRNQLDKASAAEKPAIQEKLNQNIERQKIIELKLVVAQKNKEAYDLMNARLSNDPRSALIPGLNANGMLYLQGRPGIAPDVIQAQMMAAQRALPGYQCYPRTCDYRRPQYFVCRPTYINNSINNSPGAVGGTVIVQNGGVISGRELPRSSGPTSNNSNVVNDDAFRYRRPGSKSWGPDYGKSEKMPPHS